MTRWPFHFQVNGAIVVTPGRNSPLQNKDSQMIRTQSCSGEHSHKELISSHSEKAVHICTPWCLGLFIVDMGEIALYVHHYFCSITLNLGRHCPAPVCYHTGRTGVMIPSFNFSAFGHCFRVMADIVISVNSKVSSHCQAFLSCKVI